MNTIKLPVKPRRLGNSDLWTLDESDGRPLAFQGSEEQARQIAIAINCHDTLVLALSRVSHSKDSGAIARAALAKVEDLRKNTAKP